MGTEVIAARSMNGLYILLDIVFLLILLAVLLWTRRYQAVIAGLLGGVLYMLIDYGVFYLLLGTRAVYGAGSVLVSFVAVHELWFHKLCLDLAVAGPGRPMRWNGRCSSCPAGCARRF